MKVRDTWAVKLLSGSYVKCWPGIFSELSKRFPGDSAVALQILWDDGVGCDKVF